MNLSYLILFPFALFILNLWIWLFDNIFHFGENKNKIFFLTIIMGFLSGFSMLLYPYITTLLGKPELNFTINENLQNLEALYYFLGYLALISILIKILMKNFKINFFFLKAFIGIFLLFLLTGYLSINNVINITLIYYVFVAFGEEILKYTTALNFYEKWKLTYSDIIIFSTLSAIGFAFVENMVYMISSISGNTIFGTALLVGGGILISRGIIGFLVHTLFTGNIGFFTDIALKKNKHIYILLIGFILGIGLHYIYNMTITEYKISIIFFIVIGYFWISFLFFKSDRIYLNESVS